MNRFNLRRWNDFDWDDYIERGHLTETFNVRHLPIKNGSVTLTEEDLPPPPIWSRAPRTTATATSMKTTTVTVRKKRKTVHKVATAAPQLMWDYKTETWVANTMGSESPAAFEPITKSMADKEGPKTKRKKKGKRTTRKRR